MVQKRKAIFTDGLNNLCSVNGLARRSNPNFSRANEDGWGKNRSAAVHPIRTGSANACNSNLFSACNSNLSRRPSLPSFLPHLTRLDLMAALRRWKRFFPTFDAIDAAVEASDPARHPSDELQCVRELQRVRGQIVELLCDTSEDGAAEELCRVLDDVMVESLITLQSVPVTPSALASTDLAKAVGALGEHESEQIRGLARDVIRGWRASVEGELARDRAAMEALDKLSDDQLSPQSLSSVVGVGHARSCHVPVPADEDKKRQVKYASWTTKTASVVRSNRVEPAKRDRPAKVSAPLPKKSAPVVSAGRANMANMDKKMPAVVGPGRVKAAEASVPLPKKTSPFAVSHVVRTENTKASTMISESLPKKTPPFDGRAAGDDRVMRSSPEDKMEATKRKLREGYQEVEDAKRQRKIQVIEGPKMLEQKQRKMHPIMRERSQARCATSTAVRRSLMSAFHRV
ncbi:probable mediator of RNA polymerase II transcription subunit 26a [Phragmites australis]|uniref:probable mediator of RNA polymerase II transcription subunit 26a n=1 Tax=Phragmites australis TaxID=29695 RepID=UPI002D76C497|nr:probable mediator of RNA polymerase II transcription subunit 26a [Phragmites australis]